VRGRRGFNISEPPRIVQGGAARSGAGIVTEREEKGESDNFTALPNMFAEKKKKAVKTV